MDELIERSLRGEVTPQEQARLTAWRKASPENELTFRRTARLLRLVAEARPFLAGQASRPPGAEEATARASDSPATIRLHPADSAQPHKPSRRSVWRVIAPVAGVAALLALAVGLTRFGARRAAGGDGPWTFQTSAAEVRTVRLLDGTVVRLAPASQLRVDPALGGRDVWLSGRAFLAVAPDPSRPFRVRTAFGDAIALGTRFELRAERDSLRLLVVEGHVRLATSAGRLDLMAGEMTGFSDGAASEVVRVTNPHLLVSWAGNFLAFESTPLAAVAVEIEGRYGIPIKVPDSALGSRTVTGEFTDLPIRSLLDAICRVVGAQCVVSDSLVTITSAEGRR